MISKQMIRRLPLRQKFSLSWQPPFKKKNYLILFISVKNEISYDI